MNRPTSISDGGVAEIPVPDRAASTERRMAGATKPKARHWYTIASFFVLVLLPVAASAFYLYVKASDQYASTVAFSVRTEEVSSAVELLGGITELSGSSSSDTDILYEFIQSQGLVADIDQQLDLRGMWSKPENDPVFAYSRPGTIEDLVKYWQSMVQIAYDTSSGLMEIRVLAFDPDDATLIANAVLNASSEMINGLTAIAREDSIRYAREELGFAVERLKNAREVVSKFRNVNQILDPTVDLQTQAGIIGTLQVQLTEALIELDLLKETSRPSDPRIAQVQRRIVVIEERIDAERRKLGLGTETEQGDVFANVLGEFERIVVDQEFAEQSYISAQAAFDSAQAEARRQSRYLAAHILPTKAERSEYPRREVLIFLVGLFLTISWSILVLLLYALKDRR